MARIGRLGAMVGVAALAFGAVQADAAPIFYFGENLAPAETVSGDPLTARTNFLSGLSGSVGTEDFEALGAGTLPPIPISFPGSSGGITATLNSPDGGICDTGALTVGGIQCNELGRFPTSGDTWFHTSSTAYSISFDTPISAFGFYGTDIGDFEGQLTVQLDGGPILNIPHTLGAANGSLLFWGFIDPVATYSTITFGSTTTADVFGFDDMTIGDLEQVRIPVPEPGTVGLFGLALLVLGLSGQRRRSRKVRPVPGAS